MDQFSFNLYVRTVINLISNVIYYMTLLTGLLYDMTPALTLIQVIRCILIMHN